VPTLTGTANVRLDVREPVTISGEYAFDAPPEAVRVALADPVTAGDALPGTSTVTHADGSEVPDGSLSWLLAADGDARRARTVAGGERYDVEVSTRGSDGPRSLELAVTVEERTDRRLSIAATADAEDDDDVDLIASYAMDADAGACRLTWRVRVDAAGGLALAGGRDVEAAVTRTANDYFAHVDAVLAAAAGPASAGDGDDG